MSTQILIKRSSIASAVPTAQDITTGELAVNTVDKRIYTNNNGTIVELGTYPSTQAVQGNATIGGTLGVTGATTLASGSVTGNFSVAGTLTVGTPSNSTDAASKGYVDAQVSAVLDNAPAALDTLNELAAALNDDANFATTVTNALATKLNLAGGTMTGSITMGANKVTSTATPTVADDLTRKGYVDGLYQSTVDAEVSAAAAAVSETNAAASAASASSSASTATTQASNASTSASNAASSATAAASSATSAANSATASATSATQSAASATQAQALVDSIESFYLGAEASAPTVDDNGDPLQAGDWYFNTTDSQTYIYNGSSWQSVSPDLVSDLTPQLGGNLDLNGYNITGTGNLDVTGTATMDGLTVDGIAQINSTTPRLRIFETDTVDANTEIKSQLRKFEILTISDDALSGSKRFQIDHATGDISFFEDTGSTPKLFWDASAESLGIGTASPTTPVDVVSNSSADALTIRGRSADNIGTLRFKTNTGTTTTSQIQDRGNEMRFATIGAYPMTFLVNSSEKMRIDSSGNVGIGTSAPSSKLDARGGNASQAVINWSNELRKTGSLYSDTGGVGIYEGGLNNAGIYLADNSKIDFRVNGSERMRIDSSGNLLVGTTSTSLYGLNTGDGIELNSSSFIGVARASGVTAVFNRRTTDGSIVDLRKDGTTVGSIGSKDSDTYIGTGITGIRFRDGQDVVSPTSTTTGLITDGATSLGFTDSRFKNLYLSGGVQNLGGASRTVFIYGTDSSSSTRGILVGDNKVRPNTDGTEDLGASGNRFKDLYLSGGVYLGGTGAANKLDDYEEGTWTPTLEGRTTAGTPTYTFQGGLYSKVGDIVHIQCNIVITNWTGQAGEVQIGGLPFTATNASSGRGYSPVSTFVSGYTGYTYSAGAYIQPNEDNIRFADLTNSTADTAFEIRISGTYKAA